MNRPAIMPVNPPQDMRDAIVAFGSLRAAENYIRQLKLPPKPFPIRSVSIKPQIKMMNWLASVKQWAEYVNWPLLHEGTYVHAVCKIDDILEFARQVPDAPHRHGGTNG